MDFKARWKRHKYELNKSKHPNKHLQSAWNKYGQDNFKFEIIEYIEECEDNVLNEREKYWIDKTKSYNRGIGYNKTFGGDGVIPTDETREKISETIKSVYENNPELHKKISDKTKEFYVNHPEARKRQGEQIREFYENNPESREYMSNKMKEVYKNDPSISIRQGQSRKEYYNQHPEARERVSKLNKEQVKEIKKILKEGKLAQKEIAKLFDVSDSTIRRINTGETWSHIKIA